MGRFSRGSQKHTKRVCGRRKKHESDPERTGTEVREDSPTFNSLDEENLWDYVENAGTSGEEMEVTKRLSCLNFSVIPCALDPGNFSCESNIAGGGACDVSDVELYSEITSATHLDVLPSDGDTLSRRQNRKRASRRKPNKRTKKLKPSNCGMAFTFGGTSTIGNGCSKVKLHSLSSSHAGHSRSQLRHIPTSRVKRRSHSGVCLVKRRKMEIEDDSYFSCFLSDTSVAYDMEVFQDNGDDRMSDCTPQAEPSFSTGGYPNQRHGLEFSPQESELSESTTDSGCEGDDEESSVEGPNGKFKISGWWEKDSMITSSADEAEEDRFSQILNGSFPLMSESSQQSFTDHLQALSEFKHPGRFGILCGRSGRKKRHKPSHLNNSLKEVNQKIVTFVQSSTEIELKFPLLSRAMCRTISNLARVYNLECLIEQKRRLPVASPTLRKTPHTKLAVKQEVEPVLRGHGRDSPTTLLFPPLSLSGRQHAGVVGGKAPPLDDSNVGNRMLQGMGWVPGMGLGPKGGGIQDPITACVRPRRLGLGYN